MIEWLLDPEAPMDIREDNDVHSHQEAVKNAPDDYPPYPVSFPPLIQHLIDAKRARKWEEEKQKREEEKARRRNQCYNETGPPWKADWDYPEECRR